MLTGVAASMHAVPADNPLAISFDDLQQDFAVNTAGVVVAAKRAVEGFAQLPDGASKTFIYTGNFLNEQIMPALFSGGIGKSATAHVMHVASNAYADKGYQ